MRDDFCALILSHGRPDRVRTIPSLKRAGYTGKTFIVVDDEDKTLHDYERRYGDKVLQFSKQDIATRFDLGDNFPNGAGVIYARNASFDLARSVGCRYFIQLDDDYSTFDYRFDADGHYRQRPILSLDVVLSAIVDYLAASPFASIAMGQGGDYLGGAENSYMKSIGTRRKAMNTFICDAERPFKFSGRINEDVNTYTASQRAGLPFLTLLGISISQAQTQKSAGGMTDFYVDHGTFVKSFYSVMFCPSSVAIGTLGTAGHQRLHHRINWNATAPLILRADPKKSD
jgi:glycosyltransferase involved in cell wall biosynthesis